VDPGVEMRFKSTVYSLAELLLIMGNQMKIMVWINVNTARIKIQEKMLILY
jgi:hypothetical protein